MYTFTCTQRLMIRKSCAICLRCAGFCFDAASCWCCNASFSLRPRSPSAWGLGRPFLVFFFDMIILNKVEAGFVRGGTEQISGACKSQLTFFHLFVPLMRAFGPLSLSLAERRWGLFIFMWLLPKPGKKRGSRHAKGFFFRGRGGVASFFFVLPRSRVLWFGMCFNSLQRSLVCHVNL